MTKISTNSAQGSAHAAALDHTDGVNDQLSTDTPRRVLVVEDVAEIAVDHPHTVRLQARQANVEGVGRVDLVDLVRRGAQTLAADRGVGGDDPGQAELDWMARCARGGFGLLIAAARFKSRSLLKGWQPCGWGGCWTRRSARR